MKIACWPLALLLLGFQEDPPEPGPPDEAAQKELDRRTEQQRREQEERVRELVGWLKSSDEELSEVGRRELIKLGSAAVPALEEEIRSLDADSFYGVIREIRRAELSADEQWVDDREMERIAEQLREAGKALPSGAADRYVYAKYHEAYLTAKQGNYQRGYDMTNSLLILEPKSKYAAKLKEFRRFCDQRVTQTTLVQAEVIVEGRSFCIGDQVKVLLRMKNVSPQEITLRYGQNGRKGKVLVPYVAEFYDPLGGRPKLNQHSEIEVDEEITIATGAQWETVFVFDTASIFAKNDFFRTITFNAWTQPVRLEALGFRTTKKIVFEPAVIRVIPKRYSFMREDPKKSLGELIGPGNLNEMLCAALLLDGEERAQGLEMLLTAMEQLNAQARGLWANLLYQITDEKLGSDPEKWREWIRKKEEKEKPEK